MTCIDLPSRFRRRPTRVGAAALALAAAAIPVSRSTHAQEPAATVEAEEPIPTDPAVRIGQLSNGVRYYIRENGRPEGRVELRLVVDAGSILEDDDQLGLAHFVEHMAFNGSENFSKQELIDYMESIGMRMGPHVSAYTSFDETVYSLTVPTDDPAAVATAFQILEDWAHLQSFDPEEVEKERGVVIEEWRLRLGAFNRIQEQQWPVLFHDSRYADRFPIGEREILENFDKAALKRFYTDWYRPDLMAVVAVGDFSSDEIESLIARHFSRIPAAEGPRTREEFDVPDHSGTLVSIATDRELPFTQIQVVHKQPSRPVRTLPEYRQRVVEWLYTAMLNGRFFELGQEPDAPFVFAGNGQGSLVRSKESYSFFAQTKEGRVEDALRSLLVEGERVARHGFTATELERQEAEILRATEHRYDDRDTRESATFAAEYERHFLDGSPIPGIEYDLEIYRRFLPTVELEEVNRLAGDWIRDENRVILLAAPEKEGLRVPDETELLAVVAETERAQIEAYVDLVSETPLLAETPMPGEIVREERIEEIGLTVWELSNGVRVLVKPTDFEDDQIVLRAISNGGSSLAPDELYIGTSMATGAVIQGGIGELSLVDLTKVLAGKAVSVRPSIGRLTEGLSGSASPKDVETMFQLVYLYFTAPRRDSSAFVALQNQLREGLRNRALSPMAAFQDTIRAIMSQGHPRTTPWTLETVELLDLERSLEFYRDRFSDAGDFTFVLVGVLDPETLRPLVRTYLGALPATGRVESWRDLGIEPPTGVVRREVRRGVEPKSQTTMIFSGSFENDKYQRQALRALGDALQIRLREVMREDLGGTYSVRVSPGYDKYPRDSYRVAIGFGSAPDRVEELVSVVLREIEAFQGDGPVEDYAQKAREIQRRARETDLESNRWWAGQLIGAEWWGEDPRTIPGYEWIDRTSVEMIREATRRYLRLDNYVLVSLYPEASVP